VVQTPSGEAMRFKVDEHTQVEIGGRYGTAAQIPEGAEARVVYEPSANGHMAVTVAVNPSAAASGSAMGRDTPDTTAPATGTGSSSDGASAPAPASPPEGTNR